MPDRKQLLQDFYTKYAPDEELSDERLAAIDAKYMGNDKQLLIDLYGKYAPDQELTDERYNAITTKYGLGKQPASPSGSGAASSSAQSAQQPEPSEPSGATSDPVQQEIDRLQSKYESALKTNSNWLTGQENQQLIGLKKQKQGEKDQSYKKDQDKYINEKILSRSTPVDVKKQLIALDQEYIKLSKEMNSYSEKAKTNVNAKASQDQLKAEMQDIRNRQSRLVGGGDLITEELKAANQEGMDLRKVDVGMPTEERAPKLAVPPTTNFNVQVYGNIAPNANASLNLAELETKLSKETAKVPEGTTSVDLIGLKNEIEGKYKLLESDYLAFLESTNKARYDNYTSRLSTIKEKGEATTDDQKFLREFRNEALNIRLESDKQKVEKIKRQIDLPTYQAQSELINQEAKKLNAEYKSYFNEDGTPKSPLAQEKAKAVASRINALMEKQKLVQEKTGLTDDVIAELDNAYDSQAQGEVLQKGWNVFSELTAEERENKEDETIRKQVAETGNPAAKGALMIMSFMDEIGSGVSKVLEVPKVLADAVGYGAEDGWTDYLYDVSRDLNNKAAGRLTPLDSESTLMNIGDIFAKGAANVVLFASGGEAVGAIKAGSTIMKNAGIVTSAFLLSEGDNYREALAAGLSPEDAAQYSTMISAAQALTEAAVPDYKYFDPAARKSIMVAIKEGKDVKEAFKQYGKQLLIDVPKTGIKEIGEEIVTEITGDAIKEGINAYKDATIYKDTFNPETYANVALTAFVTGGGLTSLKRGVRELTPNEESLARMVGENADAIVENIVTTEPEAEIKIAEDVGNLKEIVTGLKNIPSYEKLGEREKDFVVNKLMQKRDLEKSMKMTGVNDAATKAEIQKIESDINAVYNGKKIGEEYSIEDAPEKLNVGDTVVFGKPEQNIVEENTPLPANAIEDKYDEETKKDINQARKFLEQDIERDTKELEEYNKSSLLNKAVSSKKYINELKASKAQSEARLEQLNTNPAQYFADRAREEASLDGEENKQSASYYEYVGQKIVDQDKASALSVEENKVLNERVSNPVRTVALEGIDVAYNGMKGTMKMSDGKMVDNVGDIIPEGNYVFVPKGTNNRAGRKGIVVVGSQEDIDSNSEFVNTESNPSWAPDQNNVANMKLPNGDTLSIMDENLSGNMGLKNESKEFNVKQPYLKSDDQKNKQGVSGGVGGQQTTVQKQPDQGTGTETTTPSGVVQGTQEVDFDGAPAITIEEETDNAAAYDDAMASVVEFDDTVEDDDLDTATAFVQMGATPEEAVGMIREEKEAIEQASKGAEFNPKSSKKVAALVQKKASFATVVKQGGKKYVVVGLKLAASRKNKTAGRDNYSFASYELNENTPSNIVEILEKQAKENFKNIYPDFSDSDVIKPIATTEAFTIPKAAEKQPVAETATTKPGEYTPSRKTELKDKYKGQPKAAVLEYLDKAARAFRKTFSKDTPVFVFETAREMHDALVAQGRDKDFDPKEGGAFAYDEDGTVYGIYLNMENADAAVAPHEFVHNVLLEVFGQDPEVYAKFRDKVLEMFKGSNIDRLKKWAEENYNEESSPEEFITELTAQLAVTDKELELPTTLVDKFKDIVNSVFRSVSGMNVFSDRATKKDVVEFINAMASGLAAGRAIDLQAGKRLAKERAKELAKSKPVSKAKVREQSRRAASQIAGVDAAQASAMSVDDRIMAGRLRDQIAATNPDLDFIIDNFDKIERAMVKEGKLKVNCEL